MFLSMIVLSFHVCLLFFFFFMDTATTDIYTYGHTLSLHDALPICARAEGPETSERPDSVNRRIWPLVSVNSCRSIYSAIVFTASSRRSCRSPTGSPWTRLLAICAFSSAITSSSELMMSTAARSEEHTSELQSLMRISYAVFCLKKKNKKKQSKYKRKIIKKNNKDIIQSKTQKHTSMTQESKSTSMLRHNI